MECVVCGQVTAHFCTSCHKPVCRQHCRLFPVGKGNILYDYCEYCAPHPAPRVRRHQATVPAESQHVTVEDRALIEERAEAIPVPGSPQSLPVAFEWQNSPGKRYRLVMSQTDSGKRQLITEYCQQDSLGNDSWRILEVARDAQAACAHLYDALRAFEVALARLTLSYPD